MIVTKHRERGSLKSTFWNPTQWRRIQLVFMATLLTLGLTYIMEFSYTSYFASYTYGFVVVYKGKKAPWSKAANSRATQLCRSSLRRF